MRGTHDLLAILKTLMYSLLIIIYSGHIRTTLSVVKFKCSDDTLVPTTYSAVCGCPGNTEYPVYCSSSTFYCSSDSFNPSFALSELCNGTPDCADNGDERCVWMTTTNGLETTTSGTVANNAGTVTTNAAQTMKLTSTTSKNTLLSTQSLKFTTTAFKSTLPSAQTVKFTTTAFKSTLPSAQTVKRTTTAFKSTLPSAQTMKLASTTSKNTVPSNAASTNTAIAIITTTDSKTTSSLKTNNAFQWHQSYLLTVSVMCTGVILTIANFFNTVSSGMANLPIQQQRMMLIRFPVRYQMIQRRIPLKYRLRPERFIRRRYVRRRQFFIKRRIFFQIPFQQSFYM